MGLAEILAEDSTLTQKELQSLQGYLRVKRRDVTFKEVASQRPAGSVTVGSYYRTIQMGRKKMKGSLATVLIGLWLGLIKLEDLRRLLELVGKGDKNLSDEDIDRLKQVLSALLDKIVM